MQFTIRTSKDFNTINWSGGTSTQLFIFPLTADYQLRNFDFRLSTAKVEVEESNFTSLPGVSRKIMILDGEISIKHEGHYTKQLKKFDVDEFEGDWKTSSVGKCIDFNLMTIGNTTGKLKAVSINKTQLIDYPLTCKWRWILIYVLSGKISFAPDANSIVLNQGDLLIIDQNETASMKIQGIENSEFIVAKVSI